MTSFTTGEIAPSMFGRTDVARYHTAATTMRNFFPSYRGPAYSRAGTAFCGYSKQTGRSYRPRLVPFQFSISQGLMLEFGNFYMRVLYDGAFVTETAVGISAVTKANPAVITAAASGSASATSNNGAVTSPYAPGEQITLAGGTYTTPAVLQVGATTLLSVTPQPTGTGHAPGDVLSLTGGTQTTAATVTILTTTVVAATINAAGTGGTNGTTTVTGTTGTGTKFQANVTIAGGAITTVNSITLGGSYTVNPTVPGVEPVTGGGLTGAELAVSLAPLTISLTTPGVFTANPAGYTFTQGTSTGTGTGATFVSGLFAPYSLTVATAGAYTSLPGNPVSQASTTGIGLGATYTVAWGSASAFSVGDWVYVSGVVGMTQLNGETYVISNVAGSAYTLADVFGNPIDSTGFTTYTSGGSLSRIYTLSTIYAEADLDYLKFVESADLLTFCCVNQETGAEYVAQNLQRLADDNWVFTPAIPTAAVLPPAIAPTLVVSVPPAGTVAAQQNAYYQYVVTAIDASTGEESIASPIAMTGSNATTDIAQVLGTVLVSWKPVDNVHQYNVYKAPVGYGAYAPAGSLFGFISIVAGTSFLDTNITPDYSQVPPTHENPFARGALTAVNLVSGGVITNGSSPTATINTSTGSDGAVVVLTSPTQTNLSNLAPVTIQAQGFIINEAGQSYAQTDTITIGGAGVSGVVANLVVGPESGTYPGTVGYFQQRRAYANSLNQPDTYWMSKPGAFNNFDSRTPPVSSDAITGSPWATEVNGIQWMLQTSGGLLVMTGLSAWLLVGSGSFATNVQPISPSTQDNVPQAFSGCSAKVFPIKVNYDVIYLTSKNSHYYDLPYQLYALSEPIDISDVSSHLFDGFTIIDNAYCEQPNKLVWAVRDDGILLSLTYYKTQQIQGWARHDTFGSFVSCAAVTELPVDALYLATQRTISSNTAYLIERMNDRLWHNVEDAWCVDCGLALPQPTPTATLTVSSALGAGIPTGVTGLVGGSGYSSGATAVVKDNVKTNPGAGAVATLTIVAGVITNVAIAGGTGYRQPEVFVQDPAGSAGGAGFSAKVVLSNATTLTTSANVFTGLNVGNIVRANGGIAQITAVGGARTATANVLTPFPVTPNGTSTPPFTSGDWTMTAPVTRITGLNYLAGATVTGLADGNVIPPTVVAADGSITLATAASAVTIGLGFQCQLQTVYADAGEPTVQGQRKKIAAVTLRLENSRGLKVGADQRDGSTLSPIEVAPSWYQLQDVPDTGSNTPNFPLPPYNALAVPLRTGDVRVATSSGWQTPGQIAVQQDNPLPAQVAAVIPEVFSGDTPQQMAQPRQQKG